MTIKAAYEKYQVPPNLQEHMLRVAGMAKTIYDHWAGKPLDRHVLFTACLLHDIGNIIKFDLVNPAAIAFLGSEAKNVDHWREVQSEMKQKYGSDDDRATHLICQELGVDQKSMFVIDNWGFPNFDRIRDFNDYIWKICVYSDHRVGIKNVVSLKERFEDQRKRYLVNPNKNTSSTIISHLSDQGRLADCAFEVEKQLQAKVSRDLSTITDEEIKQDFTKFLQVDLK